LPFASARRSFGPFTSPVTTPRIVWPAASLTVAYVTSCPFSDKVTLLSGTLRGHAHLDERIRAADEIDNGSPA